MRRGVGGARPFWAVGPRGRRSDRSGADPRRGQGLQWPRRPPPPPAPLPCAVRRGVSRRTTVPLPRPPPLRGRGRDPRGGGCCPGGGGRQTPAPPPGRAASFGDGVRARSPRSAPAPPELGQRIPHTAPRRLLIAICPPFHPAKREMRPPPGACRPPPAGLPEGPFIRVRFGSQ